MNIEYYVIYLPCVDYPAGNLRPGCKRRQKFMLLNFNYISGVDIVLIHGLMGGVFFTWRQHDKVKQRSWTNLKLVSENDYSYCWPRDWLIDEGLDDRVRVIGVDCKSIH